MSDHSPRTGNVLLVTGIFLILVGFLALFSPVTAGSAVVKVAALVLLVTGLIRLAHAFKSQGKMETVLSAVLGAVVTGLGVMVWMNPEVGSGFLTALLTVFLVAHGLWKISAAFQYRDFPAWGWLLLSGVLSLIFAWLMWQQWPLSGAWAIGILLGLDLLLTGIVSIALAIAVKRVRASSAVDTINL